MKNLSLIVATVDRTDPLERLFASLQTQTYSNFEVILIDQNRDDRLAAMVAFWSTKFPLVHLLSEKGLSRARNKGIRFATGQFLAFPDDDCWYPPDLLESIVDWFSRHPEYSFLSTIALDAENRLAANRWLRNSAEISRYNAFRAGISFSLFFRADAVRAVGGFDEGLGLGAGTPLGSGEESDLALRVLESGHRGWFERSLVVFHPARVENSSLAACELAASYGIGFGYVLRRHQIPLMISLYLCLRPVLGWAYWVLRRNRMSRVYLASFRGRLKGYLGFRQYRAEYGGNSSSSIPLR